MNQIETIFRSIPLVLTTKEKMPPKKGLSFDEKRKKMIEYFYEKKGVFNLKQLESGCAKEKGIGSASVLCSGSAIDLMVNLLQ